jgi:phage baseplate assembly protein W
MADLAYPYEIAPSGRTAAAGPEAHVRDLVEQVLFTTPGERVNRPTFGSGLMQLVFAPNSEALAAATQATVQGALQQWLGDRIEVDAVSVVAADARLEVEVIYRIRLTQQPVRARFQRTF